MIKKLSLILAVLLMFSSCALWQNPGEHKIEQKLGFHVSSEAISFYLDTHGGFHGDGETLITFSPTLEQGEIIADSWNKTPVSQIVYPMLYVMSECPFQKEKLNSEGGYWIFSDRSLNSAYSENFDFAYFDGEKVYFYQLDT